MVAIIEIEELQAPLTSEGSIQMMLEFPHDIVHPFIDFFGCP